MLILEGLTDFPEATVYLDSNDDLLHYVLPTVPQLRVDAQGKAAMKYIQYRRLKPLPNGDQAAALFFMDIELSLPAAAEQKLRKQLAEAVTKRRGPRNPQPVKPEDIRIARPPVTKASISVDVLAANGDLVQKVNCPSSPSGYGNNVVAISGELTQLGSQIFEAAMQSEGAGGVRAVYSFEIAAKLPPITATGTWSASKFYSFFQKVDYEERWFREDDMSEILSEAFANSDSRVVSIVNESLPNSDPATAKILDAVRASIERQLDEAVKRNLLDAIPPESRDVSKIREQDFENIRRNVLANKRSDVSVVYKESQVVGVPRSPQANMPSLTSQGFAWKDYAIQADTANPFFEQLNLAIQVNCPFAELPIFSVDVSIDYPPHTAKHGIKTFTFRSTDEIARFDAFTNGGSKKFKYSYVVNYKGESRVFRSPFIEHEGDSLKINVDELGLWMVDVEVSDMDFEQVRQAIVTLEHPPVAPGVPPVVRFALDENNRTFQVKELLLTRAQAYGMSVKYFMKDGREYVRTLPDQTGSLLYVDDPFSGSKKVQLRTRGDFERQIDNISVDLSYEDEANGYRQTQSIALSKEKRFFDWEFPVIDERAGKVKYRALTIFQDGSTVDEGLKQADGVTLLLGVDTATLDVTVLCDLLDFESEVKLASVELRYTDAANDIDERESFVFRKGTPEAVWSLPIRDRSKVSYTWSARIFMLDGSRKELASVEPATAEKLFIELPA